MDDVTVKVTGVSSIGEATLNDTGTDAEDTGSDKGGQGKLESELTDREGE